MPRYPPIYQKICYTAESGCILVVMAQEIEIDGVSYVSSKRAAHMSGYAQDYIGQLCRAGLIQAQRIGGLWYLTLNSLYQYKQKADSYVPVAPRKAPSTETDSLVAFDGKDYISAARAAEITGYHQDYVGQLAREGKVLSRQVGSRWYVERAGILAHKKEKDTLLAAVQSEAVGLYHSTADNAANPGSLANRNYNGAGPYLTYTNDDGDLLPQLAQRQGISEDEDVLSSKIDPSVPNTVHIRVLRGGSSNTSGNARILSQDTRLRHASTRNGRNMTQLLLPVAAVATIVIVLTVGYTWQGAGAVYTRLNPLSNTAASGLVDSAFATLTKIGDVLERLITTELVFKRAKDFSL